MLYNLYLHFTYVTEGRLTQFDWPHTDCRSSFGTPVLDVRAIFKFQPLRQEQSLFPCSSKNVRRHITIRVREEDKLV
jgi:hypothetical protein